MLQHVKIAQMLDQGTDEQEKPPERGVGSHYLFSSGMHGDWEQEAPWRILV